MNPASSGGLRPRPIFGLLLRSCAGLVVSLLFTGSILALTKSQLQNAADAGACSAAVLQARDANFSTCTNRAMDANQVAVDMKRRRRQSR